MLLFTIKHFVKQRHELFRRKIRNFSWKDSSSYFWIQVPTNLPKPPVKQPKQEGEGEGKKSKKSNQNAAEGQKPALTKGEEDSDTDESDASSSEDSEDEQPKQGKKK